MKNLTVENLIAACRGEWYGSTEDLEKSIQSVTTDSRKVTQGCLFAALKGEKFDGNDFIFHAWNAGALCCLSERIPESDLQGNLVLVPSVLTALQQIAAFYRRQLDITVIGITGSVGKTTAKDMIASVLSQRFQVHKTAGNFNNDLGVPLSVFSIPETAQISVLELGVSHPGDMDRIAQIVSPDIAVFTLIGDAHLEFFGNRNGVFAEKTRMLAWMPKDGTVILNGDDPFLQRIDCRQKVISFGKSDDCLIQLMSVSDDKDHGMSDLRITIGDEQKRFRIHGTGEAEIYAALEGITAGILFDLSDSEIQEGLLTFTPTGHRLNVISSGSLKIIDDCYNANPTSVSAAIRSMPKEGRRVCILGDMLELGEKAPSLHREIGALADSCGIESLLAVGTYASSVAEGFHGALTFSNVDKLIETLHEQIRPGDTILVKASRSMRFERVVDKLCELDI